MEGVPIDRGRRRGPDAGQPDAHGNGSLEGRRCLQAVNRQGLVGREPAAGGIPPPQFRPLALGQPHMGVGQDPDQITKRPGCHARQRRDNPVSGPEQVVARIQRRGEAPLDVQRGPAVTHRIVVLDVVVDERGFVKDLDGHGRRPGRRAVSCWLTTTAGFGPVGRHGVESGQRDEGPEELSAAGEKVGGNRGRCLERWDVGRQADRTGPQQTWGAELVCECGQGGRGKHLGCLAQQRQIVADGGGPAPSHAQQAQHPFHINRFGGQRGGT